MENRSLRDAMRKRPGMYLGDSAGVGCLRLVGTGIEILLDLLSEDDLTFFQSHAFLDVAVIGADVEILIDFSTRDVKGVGGRAALVHEKFAQSEIVLNVDHQIGLLVGLTEELQIAGCLDGQWIEAFEPHSVDQNATAQKGSFVSMGFTICDVLDASDIEQDFVEGFLVAYVPFVAKGLVLRNISLS